MKLKKIFILKLEYIDKKDYKKINFEQYENYLIISTNLMKKFKTV